MGDLLLLPFAEYWWAYVGFIAALLVGLADTFGKVLVPEFASVAVYAVMAVILLWRPQGLFGRA